MARGQGSGVGCQGSEIRVTFYLVTERNVAELHVRPFLKGGVSAQSLSNLHMAIRSHLSTVSLAQGLVWLGSPET